MNAAMNLPQKRRGLSPEGKKIRERAQGTLHVGGYGGPMFPAGRRTKADYIHDNIERLQEIQAKCKQNSAPSRREPLKATREPTVKVDSLARRNKNEGQLVSISRAEEQRQKRGLPKSNGYQGNGRMIGSGSTTHSDYYSLSEDHNDNSEDNQALSPYGRSQLLQEELSALTAEGESRPGSGLINPIKNSIMQNLRDSKNEEHFSRNSLKFPQNKAHVNQQKTQNQQQQQHQYQQNQQQISNSALSVRPRSSRQERRAHVSEVITRIKGQRPACEIEYNKYCRDLENQHRLLLNPSETLSMYGETVDGSIAGRNSHRNNGSVRGRSSSTDRDSVISRNSSRRQQHPPKQQQRQQQQQQQQHQQHQQQQQQNPRRFSRSTSNLSSVARSQMIKTPLDRPGTNPSHMQNGNDRRHMSSQIRAEKNPLPSLSRSKSNLESRRRANSISSNRNTSKNYLNADHTQETDRLSYASRDLDFYNDNKNTDNKQVWGTPRQMHLDNLNVTDATENKDALNDGSFRSCRHNEHYHNDTYEENEDYVEDNYGHPGGGNINGVDGNESGSIYYENDILDSPRYAGDQHDMVKTLRTAQNDDENGVIPSSRNGLYYSGNEEQGTSHNLPEVNYEYREELEDYDGRSIRDGPEYSYTYQDRRSSTPQQPSPDMQPRSSLRRSRSQQQLQQLKRKNQEKKEKQQQELKQKNKPRHKPGSMPKYMQEIKLEQARQEAALAAIDPECPEGHTALDDAERRNTLHLLKKSQAEVMRDISSLPVANDTLRLKKHREELEEKLNQIEGGLAIFSQPKVYVLNDDD